MVWNIQLAFSSDGTLKVARSPEISTNARINGASSAPCTDKRNGNADSDRRSTTNSDEIARIMGLTAGNVRVKLHRALEKIRELLISYEEVANA